MKDAFLFVVYAALVIHIALIGVTLVRVWRGENVIDRLIAADLIGTIVLAVFVLMGLINGDPFYMDLALGFAALTFISTIALARYIGGRQIF